MKIIGCDLHSRFQQIAMLDTERGELVTARLEHENGEAKAFYTRLPKPPRIGVEARRLSNCHRTLINSLFPWGTSDKQER
jgi:hypothetical protein